MCASFHSFAALLDKFFEKLIINQFVINGKEDYSDNDAREVFDVKFSRHMSLLSQREFFDKKIGQFNCTYLFHPDSLSGNSGLDDNLRNKKLDAQLNVTAMSMNELDNASSWHKERAKTMNSGVTQ